MTIHFQKTIAAKDSSILLTTHMIEEQKVIQDLHGQARFLTAQMQKTSLKHYPIKSDETPVSLQAAMGLIRLNETLRTLGEKAVYFAYDRKNGKCVGMITATAQDGQTVEITQSVERTDNIAQYEMLRLIEKSLMEQGGVRKIVVKVVDDYMDNMRQINLRALGYTVESVTRKRLWHPEQIDYITYAKINPQPTSMVCIQKQSAATNKKNLIRAVENKQNIRTA